MNAYARALAAQLVMSGLVWVLEPPPAAHVIDEDNLEIGAAMVDVVELRARGVPVVCLPLGGPPLVAERNAVVAPLTRDLGESVASAVVEAARRGGTPHDRWSPDRLPALVERWYARAEADER